MPRLLLFDVDGTLVLTGGAGVRAMTRAFYDLYAIDDGFDGVHLAGRTDSIILRDALARAQIEHDPSALDRFQRHYVECLAEEVAQPGPRKGVMPGVRELLDALDAHDDVFLALLTGNFRNAARIKLEHFDLWRYFRCGAFGEDAVERNELVPIAMERARACGAPRVDPHDVIVIGDTPLDVACARAGGARAVGVATGPYGADQLRESGADWVFENLGDTEALLEALRR